MRWPLFTAKRKWLFWESSLCVHEAKVLEPLAKKVTILTNGKNPEFSVSESGSISIEKRKIVSAKGDTSLSNLELEDRTLFPLDGLFVALGTADSTDIARKLGLFMEDNHILIEPDTSTALPKSCFFAAGDCTGGLLQISKAVYEGALAGTKVVEYLQQQKRKRNVSLSQTKGIFLLVK